MKTQQISKKELTAVKKRLTRIYRRADTNTRLQGLTWYHDAYIWIRETCEALNYNFSTTQIAGVLSALSPQNKWERNKIDTINLLNGVRYGNGSRVKVCTFNKNKEKALQIARGHKTPCEVIKAPKTASFISNIAHLDPSRVTIDRWHLRACFGTKPGEKDVPTPTPTKYAQLEKLTIEQAKMYGLEGYQFQAIIWEQLKKEWNR